MAGYQLVQESFLLLAAHIYALYFTAYLYPMSLSPQQQTGAGNPLPPATVRVYNHTAEDLAGLTIDLAQLLQKGAAPAGIGIVYPSDLCVQQLAACLQHAGIPLYIRRNTNLLEQPVIGQLLLLLGYLRAENHLPGSGDEMLFEILHFEQWAIAPIEIAHRTMEASEIRYRSGITLRQYLLNKLQEQPTDLFWQPLPKPLREGMRALETLVAATPGSSLQQLVERAVHESGLLQHAYALSQQQLDAFMKHVSDRLEQQPGMGIEELMHYFDTLRRKGQELCFEQESGNPGGVQLFPASHYTGQAFDQVFWIGPLPGHALFPGATPVVAGTRSENLPAELLAVMEAPAQKAPAITHLDDAYETRAVQAFQMNVSALNNYLRCPLAFFYHNIVRIPSPRNEAMAFGSAVHHALEVLFRKAQAEGSFPAEGELVAAFTQFMATNRELFTAAGYTQRLNHGHTVLRNYYRYYAGTWNPIVVVERNIRGVDLDDIPLKGKLDKIEFDGKKATIVDYKSGNVAYARKQLQRPGTHNPHGGDYWRQAVFYKLLVEGVGGRDWQVDGVVFDFIEPDEHGAYCRERVVVTPADEATVKAQIRTVWEKVQRHDFYTGCGKPSCHWCAFVRLNKLDTRQR